MQLGIPPRHYLFISLHIIIKVIVVFISFDKTEKSAFCCHSLDIFEDLFTHK